MIRALLTDIQLLNKNVNLNINFDCRILVTCTFNFYRKFHMYSDNETKKIVNTYLHLKRTTYFSFNLI